MTFSSHYNESFCRVLSRVDLERVEELAQAFSAVRQKGGRVFVAGLGGSSANATHAATDLRRSVQLKAEAFGESVAEVTADANDDGWEDVLSLWLRRREIGPEDCLLILSVGGGSEEHQLSVPLIRGLRTARTENAEIYAIVGISDGIAALESDIAIVLPAVEPQLVSPFAEVFQAHIWHLLVTHPELARRPSKWQELLSED